MVNGFKVTEWRQSYVIELYKTTLIYSGKKLKIAPQTRMRRTEFTKHETIFDFYRNWAAPFVGLYQPALRSRQ